MGNLLSQASQPTSSPEPNLNPQQGLWEFDELSIDSRFDTGTLMMADQISSAWYNLWVAPDCYQTQYESTQRSVCFHFKTVVKVPIQ